MNIENKFIYAKKEIVFEESNILIKQYEIGIVESDDSNILGVYFIVGDYHIFIRKN